MNKISTLLLGVMGGMILTVLAFIWLFGMPALTALVSPEGRSLIQAYAATLNQHRSKPTPETLLKGAIEGMFASINDKFGYYYSPALMAKFRLREQGEYIGLGLGLRDADDGGVVVTYIENGSPAFEAGIKEGDRIAAINGQDAAGLKSTDVSQKLFGAANTEVKITVSRASSTKNFALIRKKRTLNPVMYEPIAKDVTYAKIVSFYSKTTGDDFRTALQKVQGQKADKLILDLRDNDGGRVDEMVKVADQLLSSGIIFSMPRPNAKPEVRASAKDDKDDYKGDIVVLVNHNTASAGEILAAALQENKRAVVIGEPTEGKGVVNIEFPLANRGALILTVNEWLTPLGNSILEKGVIPNHSIKDTRLDGKSRLDTQLQKAVELIRSSR